MSNSVTRREILQGTATSGLAMLLAECLDGCKAHNANFVSSGLGDDDFDESAYRVFSAPYVLPIAKRVESAHKLIAPTTAHSNSNQGLGDKAFEKAYNTILGFEAIEDTLYAKPRTVASTTISADKVSQYYFYSPDTGIVDLQEIHSLWNHLPRSGDATVSVSPIRYRQSPTSEKFANAAVEISFSQVIQMPNLDDLLCWTDSWCLAPNSGRHNTYIVPPGHDCAHSFFLPEGIGSCHTAIWTQRGEGLWHRVIRKIIQIEEYALPAIFPLLGFAAFTVAALNSFNKLIGKLKASGKGTNIVASQNFAYALIATESAQKKYCSPMNNSASNTCLPLLAGSYVVVPGKSKNELDELIRNGEYVVSNGRIVPNSTLPENVAMASQEILSNVDYVTCDVGVSVDGGATKM